MSCRRCAFWRVPTPSSTAKNCSRPGIRTWSAIVSCSRDSGSGLKPVQKRSPRRRICPKQAARPPVHMKRDLRAVKRALSELDRQHLRRFRRTVEEISAPESGSCVVVEGRQLINFCGNDYLGLARHPALAAAMSEAAQRYGCGSGASHLVTGHGVEHERLEEELAAFTGRERALLFSTGYMANLAALASLAD